MAATCLLAKDTKRRDVINTCLPDGVSQSISRSSVPRLHFEPPVVAQDARIGQPEGLVVDEELDDLAVGYAEDGLTVFREAVSVLRVHARAGRG